jgi:hypothetical protein
MTTESNWQELQEMLSRETAWICNLSSNALQHNLRSNPWVIQAARKAQAGNGGWNRCESIFWMNLSMDRRGEALTTTLPPPESVAEARSVRPPEVAL